MLLIYKCQYIKQEENIFFVENVAGLKVETCEKISLFELWMLYKKFFWVEQHTLDISEVDGM